MHCTAICTIENGSRRGQHNSVRIVPIEPAPAETPSIAAATAREIDHYHYEEHYSTFSSSSYFQQNVQNVTKKMPPSPPLPAAINTATAAGRRLAALRSGSAYGEKEDEEDVDGTSTALSPADCDEEWGVWKRRRGCDYDDEGFCFVFPPTASPQLRRASLPTTSTTWSPSPPPLPPPTFKGLAAPASNHLGAMVTTTTSIKANYPLFFFYVFLLKYFQICYY
jgi:hypothetical protein